MKKEISVEESRKNVMKNTGNNPPPPTLCLLCGKKWWTGHVEVCPVLNKKMRISK